MISEEDKIFILKNIVAAILLIVVWIVVEPFFYAFFGIGFIWDYNSDFIPVIYR